MKKLISVLVGIFVIGSVVTVSATPWEYYGGRTHRPSYHSRIAERHYYPRNHYRHRRYRSVDPTTAAILGGTILGLGALSVYNRSQSEAASVAVVGEQERTERLRIHSRLAERTFGREGSSAVTSNEGYVDVEGRGPTVSGRECTKAEMKSAKVQYGTSGTISFPGGSFCRYNLQ